MKTKTYGYTATPDIDRKEYSYVGRCSVLVTISLLISQIIIIGLLSTIVIQNYFFAQNDARIEEEYIKK